MRVLICLLLPIALSGSLSLSATAQTGRIALASHAGRVAEASDNFGLPYRSREKRQIVIDSLVCKNDSMLIEYSRYRSQLFPASEAAWEKIPWQKHESYQPYYYGPYGQESWEEAVESLQQQYPQAKVVGFDKQLKKRKNKKPAGRIQAFPKRPFQYSYWRGLAGVVALGAVGWLLGRKSDSTVG
jgi:hypothetical protein